MKNNKTQALIKAPCKDCQKRHFGCHGECERYIKFKKGRMDYLEARIKRNRFFEDPQWSRVNSVHCPRRF